MKNWGQDWMEINIPVNFTFHDLRSYYVTQYTIEFEGERPDLHADVATTNRIYNSGTRVARKTLQSPKSTPTP